MIAEPDFEDAIPMILHEGHFAPFERISSLAEAIDIVHESIGNEAAINRKMAGALWIIGVEANSALGSDRKAGEQDALISLVTAIESAFVGFWLSGHPRDKDGGIV